MSNPIKRPFPPKKRGCQGQYFSLFFNIPTYKFTLFQWQTDYCVFFLLVKFYFCSSRHIILGRSSFVVACQYSQYSDNVLSGYFSTIWVNSVVREFHTLGRLTRKFFRLPMTRRSCFLVLKFLNKPFTYIKSGGYFPN